MFAEGSFKLPPTKFMDKVKAAVTEEEFELIKREIMNTLKNKKDYICSGSYSSLPEATNQIYTILTEILVQKVGQAINYDVKMIGIEKGKIKKKMIQINYDNSKANAAKTSCEQLIAESKISKDELLKAVQDECRRESTDDANLDKLRENAATKMQDSLEWASFLQS